MDPMITFIGSIFAVVCAIVGGLLFIGTIIALGFLPLILIETIGKAYSAVFVRHNTIDNNAWTTTESKR